MGSNNIKTEGIVLNSIKYGDNSIIVNILTQLLGRQAYMIKVNGKNRRSILPLMQPLSIVDFEAVQNNKATIHRLAEVHIGTPLSNLHFDPIKRSIALFITELLQKSVRNDIVDDNFYLFARNSVLALDEGMGGVHNFHLYFMWKLMRLLGFEPDVSCPAQGLFDMVDGCFVNRLPIHKHILSGTDVDLWLTLSQLTLENIATIQLNRHQRQRMITLMEQFYSLHIPSFVGLNSASVLSSLAID